MALVLSIDPGNTYSAYTLIDASTMEAIRKGKVPNEELLDIIGCMEEKPEDIVIEMVASYGMAVGATVFDTCVWIGRFYETCIYTFKKEPKRMFRKDVKMNLCNSMKARDSNITQALVDRFAYPRHQATNHGKGTKKDPGWFYGFSKDVWAAYALGVTFIDKHYHDGIPF